ncbi:MAG TPA: macro domain-containing protein [Tissierellaceae bacterium]|nr:macro domain-containing protein [Tissierellaceae bacterium]
MYKYKNTKIKIVQDDITEVKVDAIVNAANNTLLGGEGVDGAIHKKGGSSILEQTKKIGGCPTGEARITTAGDLPSMYVIHTVGPIYKGRDKDEQMLYNAYYNSLKLVSEYRLKTVAFPSISTGAYGYPIKKAVKVVLKSTLEYLDKNADIDEIIFVLFNNDNYQIYKEFFGNKLK